jgi:hypothetical protein
MTQEQLNRLKECKRKAMELESELRAIITEMSELDSLNNSNANAIYTHNSRVISGIYTMAYNLSIRLNATIL